MIWFATAVAGLMWWATVFTIAFALTGSRNTAVAVAIVGGPLGGLFLGAFMHELWHGLRG